MATTTGRPFGLLLVLAALALLARPTLQYCCPQCSITDNLYLRMQSKLTIAKFPLTFKDKWSPKADFCAAVANEDGGSCCDKEEIRQAADKMNRIYKGYLKGRYGQQQENLHLSMQTPADYESLKKKIREDAGRDEHTKQLELKALEIFSPIYTSAEFGQGIADFMKGSRLCYQTVYTLRVNALCLSCSPRASQYFSLEGKYLLNEEYCRSVVPDCVTPMLGILAVSKMISEGSKRSLAESGQNTAGLSAALDAQEFSYREWYNCGTDLQACVENKYLFYRLCKYFPLMKPSSFEFSTKRLLASWDGSPSSLLLAAVRDFARGLPSTRQQGSGAGRLLIPVTDESDFEISPEGAKIATMYDNGFVISADTESSKVIETTPVASKSTIPKTTSQRPPDALSHASLPELLFALACASYFVFAS